MIYRVLGVLSLVIGGIFGIVTMLVLLPFLDNFNLTLLILAGVFAILAYVFLAIGLQLFHPPEDRGRQGVGHEPGVETTALGMAGGPGGGAGPTASASRAEEGERLSQTAAPPAVSPAAAAVPVGGPSSIDGASPATQVGPPEAERPVIERVASPLEPVTSSEEPEMPPVAADERAAAVPPVVTRPSEPGESSNGGAPLGRPTPARAAFKKPGAAVPRD